MDKPRLYVSHNRAFLVRDVREGSELIGWEYGVPSHEVGVSWRPIRAEAAFGEMEPFADVVMAEGWEREEEE